MSKEKKDKKTKKEEKPKKDIFKLAKEKRLKAWEEKKGLVKTQEDSKEEFRKFFIKAKKKLSLSPEMKDVIWKHFISNGFDKKDKFKEGLENFGYKL